MDHSWRIAKKRLNFGVRKPLRDYETASTSRHVVCEGFKKINKEKKMLSPKINCLHIQLSNMTGTSNGPGFYGQMKLRKLAFLAAHTQDGFGERRDKKYPMCTMKYTAVFSDVVGLYFSWRSWTSCLDTWHHGLYQIPTDKKSISD